MNSEAPTIEKREAEAFAAEVARLRAAPEFRHLAQSFGNARLLRRIVSANVRLSLKKAFPKVKFSVHLWRRSDTITVAWTDGPSRKAVKSALADFEVRATVDKNGDHDDYSHSPFNEVFGSIRSLNLEHEGAPGA